MENGLKTLLPQTSPPQRVLFIDNILTKEQNFFKTLKREEEEIMISDPLPFPYLSFRMAPCSSRVGGYLWDPKPNHHISRVRKQ